MSVKKLFLSGFFRLIFVIGILTISYFVAATDTRESTESISTNVTEINQYIEALDVTSKESLRSTHSHTEMACRSILSQLEYVSVYRDLTSPISDIGFECSSILWRLNSLALSFGTSDAPQSDYFSASLNESVDTINDEASEIGAFQLNVFTYSLYGSVMSNVFYGMLLATGIIALGTAEIERRKAKKIDS